jgi:hypothetical protein
MRSYRVWDCGILKNWTDSLSQNICNQVTIYAAYPSRCRSNLNMQCELSSLRWPKVANILCEGMSQTVVVEDTQILPVNACLITCYLPALMLQYSEIKLFHEDL